MRFTQSVYPTQESGRLVRIRRASRSPEYVAGRDARRLMAGREVVMQIAAIPKPVIASVNGVVAGAGCNLALACDYRIASDEARLGRHVVSPAADRPQSRIGAADHRSYGRRHGSAGHRNGRGATIDDLRAQIELESEHQRRAFLSADAAERIAAFIEKRSSSS